MPVDEIHDGLPALLSIDTVANGAAYELIGEAFKRLAANIADPNTEPTQNRKITLTITAKPYKDRSGAELNIKVENKLAGLKPCDTSMFVARRNGEYLAFGRDTKQTEIEYPLPDSQVASDGKSRTN